jgi:hypothetical protein
MVPSGFDRAQGRPDRDGRDLRAEAEGVAAGLRISGTIGEYRYVKRRWPFVVAAGVLLLTITSCAPGPNVQEGVVQGGEIAGFWLGLWHGVIAPITFVISLFSDTVNVYEIHNNGNWYNLGFVLGAGVLLGGGGAGSRGRKG